MAVVAGLRPVNKTNDTRVGVDGLRLLVGRGRVTVDAGKAGIVGGDLMAIVADRAVVRNGEVGVIEGGAEPTGCRVTRVAGGGITRSDMVRN